VKPREPLEDGNYIYNGGFDVDDSAAVGVDGVPIRLTGHS